VCCQKRIGSFSRLSLCHGRFTVTNCGPTNHRYLKYKANKCKLQGHGPRLWAGKKLTPYTSQ
jgi:hypothetical protein